MGKGKATRKGEKGTCARVNRTTNGLLLNSRKTNNADVIVKTITTASRAILEAKTTISNANVLGVRTSVVDNLKTQTMDRSEPKSARKKPSTETTPTLISLYTSPHRNLEGGAQKD